MKRGDDVFFFTLVDLFAQIMFFGLVLFAVTRAREQAKLPVGISNITQLADSLTRLSADAKKIGQLRDSIKSLTDTTDRMRTALEAQYGLPPCKGKATYIATVVLRDDSIELTELTPTMNELLKTVVKREVAEVRKLSPRAFRETFEPLTKAFPKCRYFVRMDRRNSLEAPVLAVHSSFRSQLSKAGL